MKNELFSIGPITIYGYGLMIAIGVLAAYFSATYRSKKYALDPDKVFYVTVWAVILTSGLGASLSSPPLPFTVIRLSFNWTSTPVGSDTPIFAIRDICTAG